ncbi:MAG: bifunctional glutamate N-acetyltransferase/amino-acid acetyltransferase ArgJ [bacterium]
MSVTQAQGFRAAGVVAGIKAAGGRDVAVVVNDGPSAVAAGVFTANRFPAAPVQWTRHVVAGGRVRAVLLNSGGANACTGPDGFADTHRSAEHLADRLGLGAGEVAVASTGIIGHRLPLDRILAGADAAVAELGDDDIAGAHAADAIRTTDTVSKQSGRTSDGWSVGGMAKGAGMLAPSLATMLCVITTDAVVDAGGLDAALRNGVRTTFDRLDADGCMSTNDTVLLLANGASGVTPDAATFAAAVHAVCADLAGQLLADAEGATKEVAITVRGAAGEDEAVEVARAVARNNLLKCALFGNDPNWGRVLAAVGTTTARFESDEVDVAINAVTVCRAGAAAEPSHTVDLNPRAVDITVDLHAGGASATVHTNDLSIAYVHENSAYSS